MGHPARHYVLKLANPDAFVFGHEGGIMIDFRIPLGAGFLLAAGINVPYVIISLRLRRLGVKWALLRGAFPNCHDYLNVCRRYGWSPWLAYIMLPMALVGFFIMAIGVSLGHERIGRWLGGM